MKSANAFANGVDTAAYAAEIYEWWYTLAPLNQRVHAMTAVDYGYDFSSRFPHIDGHDFTEIASSIYVQQKNAVGFSSVSLRKMSALLFTMPQKTRLHRS